MNSFADLLRDRDGDGSVRPARAVPPPSAGDTPPPQDGGLRDSPEAFLRTLSPETRDRLARAMRQGGRYDPLAVQQRDLDRFTDDEKFQWVEDAIAEEKRRAALETEEAWAEQQTTINEGAPDA